MTIKTHAMIIAALDMAKSICKEKDNLDCITEAIKEMRALEASGDLKLTL